MTLADIIIIVVVVVMHARTNSGVVETCIIDRSSTRALSSQSSQFNFSVHTSCCCCCEPYLYLAKRQHQWWLRYLYCALPHGCPQLYGATLCVGVSRNPRPVRADTSVLVTSDEPLSRLTIIVAPPYPHSTIGPAFPMSPPPPPLSSEADS